jgi:glycosyltransferase involved in cell wall biosynthesis
VRVLQLNINYRGTGADRCARELYEELPSRGVDVSFWASRRGPEDPAEIRELCDFFDAATAPLEVLPDLTDWRHRRSIRALRSITREDFDVVHLHILHSGWISVRAVHELAARVPCVWTLHDDWAPTLGIGYNLTGILSPHEVKQLSHGIIRHVPYDRYHDNYKWRRTRRFLSKWLPQAGVVICPSRYMTELAENSGVFQHSRILQIPNGTRMLDVAESSMDRGAAKGSYGFNPDLPVVLMGAANLAQAHKGIDLGIDAINALAPRSRIQVLLLGHAGDTVASRLHCEKFVCAYAGSDAELARAYRAANVTLMPSLGENFPYAALESMACQTPLVAFSIGGMPEIVGIYGERGLLARAIGAKELSCRLEQIISHDQERTAMGLNAQSWVRRNCGMSHYLDRILEAYQEASLVAMAPPVHLRS